MNLLKNTFLFALGNIGSKIINFAIYPLLTYYLLPNELGSLDLILTTIMIVIPIVTLNINSALFRFGIENPSLLNNYIMNSIIINLIGAFCVMIFFTVFWGKIDFKVNLIFIMLYTISSIVFYFLIQLLRSLEKIKLFALMGIISSLLLLIFLLILLEMGYGINSYFISSMLSHIICAILIIFIIRKKIITSIEFKSIDIRIIRKMLKYSIVLIPSLLLWWLVEASDRFMINYYIGSTAVGLYAIASKLPSIITLINTFFIQAWEMKIYKKTLNHERSIYYSNIFYCYITLLIIIFAVFTIFFEEIFTGIINEEYYSSFPIMPILLMGAIFAALSSFLGTINLQLKRSNDLLLSSMIAGGTNIIINLLLIPQLGILGAAISTLFSYLILFVYRLYLLVRLKQISSRVLVLLTQFASISFMLTLYLSDLKFYLVIIASLYIFFSLSDLKKFAKLLLE